MKQILPDMKHIIVTNMNVPLYSWPLTFLKVVRQHLRGGGSFKSTFLRRFFLNLTVKNVKIGPHLPTFCHLVLGSLVIRVQRVNRTQCQWAKIITRRTLHSLEMQIGAAILCRWQWYIIYIGNGEDSSLWVRPQSTHTCCHITYTHKPFQTHPNIGANKNNNN